MSSRQAQMLEGSRLSDLIAKIEAGESVDLQRVATLQALDIARAGEVFVADAIQRERDADERAIQRLME